MQLVRLSFLLFLLLLAVTLPAQLPQKGKVYLDHNPPFGSSSKIFEYDPAQPISATNPRLNSIALPEGHAGLAVSSVLGSPDTTLTFYTSVYSAEVGRQVYVYYDPATASWVNTGHKSHAISFGAGGGFIYGLDIGDGGDVYKYDGTGDATRILKDTNVYSNLQPYDLAADCDGNVYRFKFSNSNSYAQYGPPVLYKYDKDGNLIQTWTMPLNSTYFGGGGFVLVGSEFYFDNLYRVPLTEVDSLSIVSGLITPSNVTIARNTPKLPQYGPGEIIGDMASYSGEVKLPAVSIAASQIRLCVGALAHLTASVSNAGEVLYEWYVNGQVIAGAGDSTLSFTPSDGDVVTCKIATWRLCGGNLVTESNPIQFEVVPPPQAKIELQTPGPQLCYKDTVLLSVEDVPGNTYSWGPEKYLYTSKTAPAAAFAAFKGEINVRVYDSMGCTAADAVAISPRHCCLVFIPTAFSPNGDGLNDIFNVHIEPGQHLNIFEVYNRFGQRLFSTSDPAKGWDGKFNGQPVDMGSYFYYGSFLCSDGNSLVRKGDITVVR
ncbi:T9SS type B sorting domain-containing protein [Taibaiella helva]|uniref:T9SS type B sorting domain-containing protein n=1 Tax=Taibaiella helva TaxID=2301235 RepID=UPI0013008618|nr:gliding motility-associated C-terminal domain-containing protein [Taibaiella helva]